MNIFLGVVAIAVVVIGTLIAYKDQSHYQTCTKVLDECLPCRRVESNLETWLDDPFAQEEMRDRRARSFRTTQSRG